MPHAAKPDWEAWLEARLAAERQMLAKVTGEEIGKMLGQERRVHRRELEDALRELRIELAAADETIAELRKAIVASNRSIGNAAEIIDLPARRVN
jgi:uncharacterized coiled-coil protein SlyX